MRPFNWLVTSSLAFASFCCAQSHPVSIRSKGETKVSSDIGDPQVQVIFNTTLLENSETRDGRRFAQCTKSRIPCSLTEAIRVTIAGKEAPLPRSAFADLGDISDAQITLKGHRVVLVIRGGDASESYIAKLSFIEGRLVERRMFSSEDSSHPFEISRYF